MKKLLALYVGYVLASRAIVRTGMGFFSKINLLGVSLLVLWERKKGSKIEPKKYYHEDATSHKRP